MVIVFGALALYCLHQILLASLILLVGVGIRVGSVQLERAFAKDAAANAPHEDANPGQ